MLPTPLAQLFPISSFELGFTTFAHSESPTSITDHNLNIISVPLRDSSLGVHKNTPFLTHDVVCPPPSIHPSSDDPRLAWEAKYPKGSCSPSTKTPGGMGFYLGGSEKIVDLLKHGHPTEAIFGYRVMFEKGWDWVKGGKLPGIYGGIGDAAYGCSGGRQKNRCKCFDVRLMWRRDGLGELYAYLPINETNTNALLAVPHSTTNHQYGISVGCGAWAFEPGVWTTVAERIKLNDIGKHNGELQLWINGVSVIHAKGLIFREDEKSHIKGMHFQTFFGGHEPDWASPKDQHAWFADVSGAIIR
ncbi:hypothetical protein AZE42_05525 [Rhizopogon vesiculosus]|uniref:Polysaccharide lyase 14 domain-containing protein n=1 Tax=Rhizopogon vesiculosus TaxID=180088 RepID=A0A1J8QJT7_9AGAM|nr:hypothetical protein AZE42_05525 [Rhizopogon vesiculosus]